MSITIASDHDYGPDPVAAKLDELGYEATQTSSTHSSDGARANTWAVRGWHVLCNADGSRRDFVPHRNLAVLSLRYMSERAFDAFSPVAQRFADGLLEVFAPTREPKRLFRKHEAAPRPLIRRTPKSLQLVFRGEYSAHLRDLTRHYRPELYPHGLCTSDQPSPLILVVGFHNIPIGDDATWPGERSPLTVHRDTLPLWDSERASILVAEHVERWVAAGEIEVSGAYREPPKPAGYWSNEAQLARQGVGIAPAVDEHTGRVAGPLYGERGRFG